MIESINPNHGPTYDTEITYLKDVIRARTAWLDCTLDPLCKP